MLSQGDTVANGGAPTGWLCFPWRRNLVCVMIFSALMSYASTGANAVLYKYLEEVLGVGSGNATFGVSMFICSYNVVGVLGAIGADLRWGRYSTQVVTSVLWSLGSAGLLACTIAQLSGASMGYKLALTFAGIGLTAAGMGAQQPSQAAFVGDQATSLADVGSFFAWYYFFLNCGSLLGESVCPILRQHVGLDITFVTVMGAQLIAFSVLMLGRGAYVRRDPKGADRVGSLCDCGAVVGRYSKQDWADLRNVLKIFAPLPVFWALFFQQNSTWVTQTSQMDMRLVWNTPDVLASVNDVMVCCMVPSFDRWVYPAFRRCYPCKPLRKICIGVLACAAAFLCAGFVQHKINSEPEKISVLWQLPQYVLISVAETMVAVTGLEFAYTQCGTNARSLVQSLWSLMQLGQAATGLISKYHFGTLEQDFFGYAALMGVFAIIFVAIAMRYEYKPGTDTDVAVEESTADDKDGRPVSGPKTESEPLLLHGA